MIIDAHHHLWRFNSDDYGWMDASMSVLKRDHLPEELESQLAEPGVSGTVVVQARQTIEETRWLLSLAAEASFIRGVVGWVDLQSPALEEQLGEFIDDPHFSGVRHVIQDEPDVGFMLRPAFLKGMEKLGEFDLAYDLLIFPEHLENAAKLVSMFPRQRFVLDHIAKPDIRSGELDPWRDGLEKLARQPNVFCKVSGMVTEADLVKWEYRDFIPCLDFVYKVFGTERLMIGSDWPVCRLAGEYREVMEIPKRYFEELDPAKKDRIFRENAADFYKLT
jgi:L-fuconolactonase